MATLFEFINIPPLAMRTSAELAREPVARESADAALYKVLNVRRGLLHSASFHFARWQTPCPERSSQTRLLVSLRSTSVFGSTPFRLVALLTPSPCSLLYSAHCLAPTHFFAPLAQCPEPARLNEIAAHLPFLPFCPRIADCKTCPTSGHPSALVDTTGCLSDLR